MARPLSLNEKKKKTNQGTAISYYLNFPLLLVCLSPTVKKESEIRLPKEKAVTYYSCKGKKNAAFLFSS